MFACAFCARARTCVRTKLRQCACVGVRADFCVHACIREYLAVKKARFILVSFNLPEAARHTTLHVRNACVPASTCSE